MGIFKKVIRMCTEGAYFQIHNMNILSLKRVAPIHWDHFQAVYRHRYKRRIKELGQRSQSTREVHVARKKSVLSHTIARQWRAARNLNSPIKIFFLIDRAIILTWPNQTKN